MSLGQFIVELGLSELQFALVVIGLLIILFVAILNFKLSLKIRLLIHLLSSSYHPLLYNLTIHVYIGTTFKCNPPAELDSHDPLGGNI